MNKRQRIIGIFFAAIILIVSFIALLSNNFLSGIIGIGISAGLFIYIFSGKQETITKAVILKSLFNNKITKRILILFAILVIFIIVIVIVNSVGKYHRAVRKKRGQMQEYERTLERARKEYRYLEYIEITSSAIHTEGDFLKVPYFFVKIKNKGDREVLSLTMEVHYYDNGGYLIMKGSVTTPEGESILPAEDKKFKIELGQHNYPYSQKDKIRHFKINPSFCTTFTPLKLLKDK